ncbi:MAG TPA: fluoride efflux transporter CrcB [Gaiellaceae bacterium]|nr:fluoride efflux transporter CrcB [Gaiellaceae bacterium]
MPEAVEGIVRPPRSVRQRPAESSSRLVVAVFVGGVAGALLRAGAERAFPAAAHGWPWTTFVVNIGGALALGVFATRLQERLPPSTLKRPLLGTGFCGALTTFSTLQVEVLQLARHGRPWVAAAYLGSSVVAGLVGLQLATAFTRRARLR